MRNIEIKSLTLAAILLSFVSIIVLSKHPQVSYSADRYAMPEPFASGPLYSVQALDNSDKEEVVWIN